MKDGKRTLLKPGSIAKYRQHMDIMRVESSSSSDIDPVKQVKDYKKMYSSESRLKFMQRPSLLSTPMHSSAGKVKLWNVNYRGYINLAFLMLFVSHFRLVLVNLRKYGLLLRLPKIIVEDWHHWPCLTLSALYNFWIVACILLEKFAIRHSTVSNKKDGTFIEVNPSIERVVGIAYFVLLSTLFVSPIIVINLYEPHPIAGGIIMLTMVLIFLKLLSYGLQNARYRSRRIKVRSKFHYPNNVTFFDMYYFLAAPTLVYSEWFPRTQRIRKRFVLKKLAELVFFSALGIFMFEQYVLPILRGSIDIIDAGDYVGFAERLMKLTIPNIICWNIGFYAFFHAGLNLQAELLYFGDRLFYLDFWNCTDLATFWRTWNLVVGKYCVLHIYVPLVSRRLVSGYTASFIVFFISAFFHEILVSVPFRVVKFYAFGAMMMQVPLCIITAKYTKGTQWGNIIFWLSFMCLHNICALFYYYDFTKMNLI